MLPLQRSVVRIPPGVKKINHLCNIYTIPPVYPAVMGTQHCWGANSPGHASVVSYGSRWDFGCPHPQAERYGQFSGEFLTRLQEFACTGSQCPFSAQTSWLCQVRVTTKWQQENLNFFVCSNNYSRHVRDYCERNISAIARIKHA